MKLPSISVEFSACLSAHRLFGVLSLSAFTALVCAVGCSEDDQASEGVDVAISGLTTATAHIEANHNSLQIAINAQREAVALLKQRHQDTIGADLKTVGDVIERRSCSTERTMPLNIQLAAQLNCIKPDFFTSIAESPNLKLGPAANPFLQTPAADALRDALAQNPSATFTINSSWRSVAQQHILRRWKGSCGIRVVAEPGTSHHESGLAIDVTAETNRDFRKHLKASGWLWYCDATNRGRTRRCRDIPHHTFKGGGEDLRSLNVLAFQQLWNKAHPDDLLEETGKYNMATAWRLNKAPLAGFATGTTCVADQFIASVTQTPADRAISQALTAQALAVESLQVAKARLLSTSESELDNAEL